jgi:DNA-binding transcriptional MerR regulator
MVAVAEDVTLGIRAVSEETGLTIDTLRWYERQGLLPAVARSADGRRRYSTASITFVRLVQALRRTGMPVADVRRFVALMSEGASSHGQRMALLEQQRDTIVHNLDQMHTDLLTVQTKIDHYQDLIDRGLDCEGAAVDDSTAEQQRSRISRR